MGFKHVLRYPLDIRIARRQLRAESTVGETDCRSIIGLDLYTDQMLIDCGRHLACLAEHARKVDLRIILRCGRLLLAAIAHKPYGSRFLALDNVSWCHAKSGFPPSTFVLTDVPRSDTRRSLDNARVATMLIGREPVVGTPVMPYPMHPNQIRQLDDVTCQRLRATPKSGIFFAGNQKARYGRGGMQDGFGVLSRLEVLDALRSKFSHRVVSREAGADSDAIVIRDSQTDPIEPKDWFSVLGRHEFFLCPPGASQPMCHNAVEAMAAGMIPILEYGDRFNPQLIDGKNAICFSGRSGLIDAIERIDAMSVEARGVLRRNVCSYFDNHLRGESFLSRIEMGASIEKIDRISMPFHNKDLYVDDGRGVDPGWSPSRQAA